MTVDFLSETWRPEERIHFLRSPSRMKMSFKNEEEIKASSEEEKKNKRICHQQTCHKEVVKEDSLDRK